MLETDKGAKEASGQVGVGAGSRETQLQEVAQVPLLGQPGRLGGMGRVRPGMPARVQPGGSACAQLHLGGSPLPPAKRPGSPISSGLGTGPGQGQLPGPSFAHGLIRCSEHACADSHRGSGFLYPARLWRCGFRMQCAQEVGVGCNAAWGVAGALLPSAASARCGFLSAHPGCLQTHRLLLSP